MPTGRYLVSLCYFCYTRSDWCIGVLQFGTVSDGYWGKDRNAVPCRAKAILFEETYHLVTLVVSHGPEQLRIVVVVFQEEIAKRQSHWLKEVPVGG